jgi:hypothetical protein
MRIALMLLLSGLTSPGYGQQTRIEDFAFLTGYWTGTGLGGEVEEIWMPPVDGRMFGIFKLSGEGELVFSEYMEIVEENGEFLLRLKHFNPDFSGWETQNEHIEFKLESVATNSARFKGLRYEVNESAQLHIHVTLHYDDGRAVEEPLVLNRQQLQATLP